jgi:hypothetical protein
VFGISLWFDLTCFPLMFLCVLIHQPDLILFYRNCRWPFHCGGCLPEVPIDGGLFFSLSFLSLFCSVVSGVKNIFIFFRFSRVLVASIGEHAELSNVSGVNCSVVYKFANWHL